MIIVDAAGWSEYVEGLQKPFALRISTPQTTVKAGSDLRLDIDLTNGLNQKMVTGHDITKYNVEIRDDQGHLVPLTPNGRQSYNEWAQHGGRSFTVQPGEELRGGGVYIDKLYDLSRPGKYTIQVSRTDEDSKVVVKSNAITVTVTP